MFESFTQRKSPSPERYESLLERMECRTKAEYHRDLRTAALASGIAGNLLSGNYYLFGGSLIYAIGFGVVSLSSYVVLEVQEAWRRRRRKRTRREGPFVTPGT